MIRLAYVLFGSSFGAMCALGGESVSATSFDAGGAVVALTAKGELFLCTENAAPRLLTSDVKDYCAHPTRARVFAALRHYDDKDELCVLDEDRATEAVTLPLGAWRLVFWGADERYGAVFLPRGGEPVGLGAIPALRAAGEMAGRASFGWWFVPARICGVIKERPVCGSTVGTAIVCGIGEPGGVPGAEPAESFVGFIGIRDGEVKWKQGVGATQLSGARLFGPFEGRYAVACFFKDQGFEASFTAPPIREAVVIDLAGMKVVSQAVVPPVDGEQLAWIDAAWYGPQDGLRLTGITPRGELVLWTASSEPIARLATNYERSSGSPGLSRSALSRRAVAWAEGPDVVTRDLRTGRSSRIRVYDATNR